MGGEPVGECHLEPSEQEHSYWRESLAYDVKNWLFSDKRSHGGKLPISETPTFYFHCLRRKRSFWSSQRCLTFYFFFFFFLKPL